MNMVHNIMKFEIRMMMESGYYTDKKQNLSQIPNTLSFPRLALLHKYIHISYPN